MVAQRQSKVIGSLLPPKSHKLSAGCLPSLIEPMACMVAPVSFGCNCWLKSVVQFPAYHASLIFRRFNLVHLCRFPEVSW